MTGLAVQAGMMGPSGSPLIGGELFWWSPSYQPQDSETTNLTEEIVGADSFIDGPTWVEDTDSGGSLALQCVGASQNALVAQVSLEPFTFTTDFAYSIWFRRNDYSLSQSRIGLIGTYRQVSPYAGWAAGFPGPSYGLGNRLTVTFRKNETNYWSASATTTPISDTDWHHAYVAYFGDGSIPQVFIDGIPQALSPWLVANRANEGIPVSDQHFKMGYGDLFGARGTIDGRIDDIRIFDSSNAAERAAELSTHRRSR